MFAALLTVTLLASPGPMKLVLAPGLPCQLETRLAPALAEQGLNDVTGEVRLAQRGAELELKVRSEAGALLGERTLRISKNDCAVLPKVLALLVRSWTQASLPAERVLPSSPPIPLEVKERLTSQPMESAPRTIDVPLPAEPAERAPAITAPAEVAAAPVETTPAPVDAAVEPDAGIASPLVVEPVPTLADGGTPVIVEEQLTEPERKNRFAISVSGGAASSFQAPPVVQGSLGGEWGFHESWGAALDIGIETSRVATSGEGRIEASLAWAGLMVQRHVISHLHLLAGARLWWVRASSQGFTVDGTASFVTFGFMAQAEWRQPIYRGLYLVARPGISARIRPEALNIEGLGPVLNVSPWSFFVHGGVGWNFD